MSRGYLVVEGRGELRAALKGVAVSPISVGTELQANA